MYSILLFEQIKKLIFSGKVTHCVSPPKSDLSVLMLFLLK